MMQRGGTRHSSAPAPESFGVELPETTQPQLPTTIATLPAIFHCYYHGGSHDRKPDELAPAQTRILLTIVQEAASTLGIAATTVKTHLRRVFTKKQTSGQAELVKLVAGFSSIFSQ